MPKYRKKPVEIEAVQLLWTTWNEVCDLLGDEMPEAHGVWLHPTKDGVTADDWHDTADWGPDARIGLVIPTLGGDMLARQGDWIIRGVKGEFYPCKSGGRVPHRPYYR